VYFLTKLTDTVFSMQMRLTTDRGAVLVHVAITIIGLLTFSSFVIDYGQFWVARRQAQNAADAGAHAGAIARAYDDLSSNPSTSSGKVYDSIINTVQGSEIWGVSTPESATVINFTCPAGVSGRCVTVEVHRDGSLGSQEMPTFFLKLAGMTAQPVRAVATAIAAEANSTGCLKPWMIPDKWTDTNGNNKWDAPDTYAAPGYSRIDIGTTFTLHPSAGDYVIPSDYNTINDIGGSNGSAVYEDNITGCNLQGWIGKKMSDVTGGKTGPTAHGVEELISRDPSAGWNGSTVTGPYGMASPRVVVIGTYNPSTYWAEKQQGNGNVFEITNLMAMFITSVTHQGEVTGVLVGKSGEVRRSAGAVPTGASFLSAIHMIR
jgi:hypothetical protein